MRYIAWTTEAEIVNMQPNRVDAVFDDLMTSTACRSTFTQSCSPDIVKETGVPILIMDVTLHRANPPDAIKNQRVATAEQEQRVNTEKQRKLAEDQRKDAETARAAADNAYRESMQLTPEQFLRLESIRMQRVCGRQGACTFLLGAGATPVLNVG